MKRWLSRNPGYGKLLMGLLFVIGLLIVGRRFLDAGEIKTIYHQLEGWFLPVLLGLPLVYLAVKGLRFVDLFCFSGPPLRGKQQQKTLISYLAAQMVTLIPGGYVARIGLVEASAGLGTRAVLPTLFEKGIDLFALLLLGLGASYIFPETRQYSAMLGLLLAAVMVGAASSRFRSSVKRALFWVAAKLNKEKLVREALDGERPDRAALTEVLIKTGFVLVLEFAALWLSFRAIGLTADPMLLILAYSTAGLIGRLAPTPGGFGFTEIGMVALIHNYSGLGLNEAAAATFLFRGTLYLVPALYGVLAYFLLWIPLAESKEPERLTNLKVTERPLALGRSA